VKGVALEGVAIEADAARAAIQVFPFLMDDR
jgi:hypothetical protein